METQPESNTQHLAIRSRNLGFLSSSSLIIPFLLLLIFESLGLTGESLGDYYLLCFGVISLVSFVSGGIGFFMAIAAIRMIRNKGGDSKLQRLVAISLFLNGLPFSLIPAIYIIDFFIN